MFGSSGTVPNWAQATATSPSKTRAACAPQTVAPEGVALSRSAPSRTPLWVGTTTGGSASVRRHGRRCCRRAARPHGAHRHRARGARGVPGAVPWGRRPQAGRCGRAGRAPVAGPVEDDAAGPGEALGGSGTGVVRDGPGGRSPDQLGVPADDGWGPGPHDTVEGVLEDYRRA